MRKRCHWETLFEASEQELPDQPEPDNTEPAETNENPNNPEAYGNGQNAAHVEPELQGKYPSRVRQPPQRYM